MAGISNSARISPRLTVSPLATLGGKVLAVQLDGIHTDVHEQIQPVFGAHAVGVTGGKCHSNLTVGGRHKVFLVIYK